MFSAISIAIAQFFRALTVFFGAFEKTAGAVDNMANWAEQASGNFADVAAIERKVARFQLESAAREKAKALGMNLDAHLDITDATVKPVKAVKAVA